MIPANDIEKAARAAAQIRAHEMCIDKIKELSETIATMEVSANNAWDEWCELSAKNVALIDTQDRLQREVGTQQTNIEQLVSENVASMEEIKALAERVVKLNGRNEAGVNQVDGLVVENIDLNEDNGNLRAENERLKRQLDDWGVVFN